MRVSTNNTTRPYGLEKEVRGMDIVIKALAVIGGFVIFLMVIALFGFGIQYVIGIFADKEWERNKQHFRNYIFNVKTWCSYDFPEMDELCNIFLEGIDTGKWADVGNWRDKMRHKFNIKL
jgi:hypothetical protein